MNPLVAMSVFFAPSVSVTDCPLFLRGNVFVLIIDYINGSAP